MSIKVVSDTINLEINAFGATDAKITNLQADYEQSMRKALLAVENELREAGHTGFILSRSED